MTMVIEKREILNEIIRTAALNGGKPLGMGRFERETGIKPYDWGKYWPRFSDAQREAGFDSNQLQSSYADDFLIEKLVTLIRKLGKFPTSREIRIARSHDPEFPSWDAFHRLGNKSAIAARMMKYCESKDDHADIVKICQALLTTGTEQTDTGTAKADQRLGDVYLFKSGRYYKIGKTGDTVRRGAEIRIQLPDPLTLIHSIRTDDPSGVEGYWHRRFEAKRKNGEWFDLDTADIRAFKAWRRIA